MSRMKSWLDKELSETKVLLRSIPASVITLFVVSVVCMNILANKTIFQNYFIALDGGIIISWISFLCMDMITKYFGPRAANRVAVFAVVVNLSVCFIFYLVSIIPSNAGDYTAFNELIGGTWFIIFGSTVAFLMSAVTNNVINWSIGKGFKKNPDGKASYFMSTYISTFVGQFIDNLIFSIIVFNWLAPIFWDGFHWTILQCITCALTGAVFELVMEMIFSPIGYVMLKKWKKDSVGFEYLNKYHHIKI